MENSENDPEAIFKKIEKIFKEFSDLKTDDQKLKFLAEKCILLKNARKGNEERIFALEDKNKILLAECQQLKTENSNLETRNKKLEHLSRELQKHSSLIREENLERIKKEEEIRKEVANKFQTSIDEIQKHLNEYEERNTSLRKENEDLAIRLNQIVTQIESKDSHTQKVIETKSLESKLAEAKLHQAKCILEQEKLKTAQFTQVKEAEIKLLIDSLEKHKKVEDKMREQIEFYKEKYEGFTKNLRNSNAIFESAKKDMEKLTMKTKKAESETIEWIGKYQISQEKYSKILTEFSALEEELNKKEKKIEALSSLCRALKSNNANTCEAVGLEAEPKP